MSIPSRIYLDAPPLDSLLDQIELLSLELFDQREAATNAKTINDNLSRRNQELDARLENCEKNGTFQTNYHISSLENALKTETENRDHFRTIVEGQDSFIKELKIKVNQIQEELQTKTNETEHLARQVKSSLERFDSQLNKTQSYCSIYKSMLLIQFAMISVMKPFLVKESIRLFGRRNEAQQILEYVHSLQLDIDAEGDNLKKILETINENISDKSKSEPLNKDSDKGLTPTPLSSIVFNAPPLV